MAFIGWSLLATDGSMNEKMRFMRSESVTTSAPTPNAATPANAAITRTGAPTNQSIANMIIPMIKAVPT